MLDLSMVRVSPMKSVPKVTKVHPSGSLILVELLTDQELTSSKIFVSDGKTDTGSCAQGYVLELGPCLPDNAGLAVGQRVMLQGRGAVPVPSYDGSHREKHIVDLHTIKAILDEEGTFSNVIDTSDDE